MKKTTFLIISLFLLICINACAGYKPIFASSDFQFKIADYSINGNKKLGNKIYSKLHNISKLNKNNPDIQSVRLSIHTSVNKLATVKNSSGKTLEYKINLNTNIIIYNFLTDEEVLNQNFSYYSSYKVQDQHSETLKLENKIIENLIDTTYQNTMIKISESSTIK